MGRKSKRKIQKPGNELLYISPVMLCVADLGGWILTGKLAGPRAAAEFFWFSILATASITFFQLCFYARSRDRLIFRILFFGMSGLTLVWYLLSLILPVLWVPTIGINAKVSFAVITGILFFCNGLKGFSYFRSFSEKINILVAKNYDSRTESLDWDEVLKPLKMTMNIYIPGVPERMIQLGSLFMVVSMLTGLCLRKPFPVFSVFAWGVPCIFVSSFCVQITTICLAQALKVAELEEHMGLKIRPKK